MLTYPLTPYSVHLTGSLMLKNEMTPNDAFHDAHVKESIIAFQQRTENCLCFSFLKGTKGWIGFVNVPH